MKKLGMYVSLVLLLSACATQVPYTNLIRDEFALDSDEKLAKVQFYISHTIVMDEVVKNENSTTTSNGTLINSSSTKKESVIIQAGTPCVFDSYGPKGEILVRFETGYTTIYYYMFDVLAIRFEHTKTIFAVNYQDLV